MEKNTINTIITSAGRVAAVISVVIALTMDTVADVARHTRSLVFLGIDAASMDFAQKFVFAIFPILFLLFSLIPVKSIAKVLSIGAVGMQLLIARQFNVNVIEVIGRRASGMKTATIFYVILGVIALISCFAGFFSNVIHEFVNRKLSAKKPAQTTQPVAAPQPAPVYAQPAQAQPSNNANYYNPYNM